MFKIFSFPQDIVWIIAALLSIGAIIAASIIVNSVAICISIGVLLSFIGLWFKFVFYPWYKVQHSCRMVHKGIKICYHRALEVQEKIQVKSAINTIQEKLEMKMWLSRVCIVDKAFAKLIIFLVDDINEVYFEKRYGIKYKKIAGLASGHIAVVDISSGVIGSALQHEVGHVILDNCSTIKGEAEQHTVLRDTGVN